MQGRESTITPAHPKEQQAARDLSTCRKCLSDITGDMPWLGNTTALCTVHCHGQVGSMQDTHRYLVGEGAGHDKGGVACGAAQVEQTALSQDDHAMTIGVDEAVHLGLDVLPLDSCMQQHRPSAKPLATWLLGCMQKPTRGPMLCLFSHVAAATRRLQASGYGTSHTLQALKLWYAVATKRSSILTARSLILQLCQTVKGDNMYKYVLTRATPHPTRSPSLCNKNLNANSLC